MTTAIPEFEILVAEDNPADAVLVREALKEHHVHCSLHLIKDGAEAIAFLKRLDADPREPRLDLILLDMHLPKHDGEEILKTLRSTKRYPQTHVIVMTGSDSAEDQQKASENAAVHYFRKPSNLKAFMQLGEIVRHVLVGMRHGGQIEARMGVI